MKRALGKTGATGHTMAMVDPQLHRPEPEHGDRSECILLEMKITQLYSFSVRSFYFKRYRLIHVEIIRKISFYTRWHKLLQIEIMPLLCLIFNLM